MSLFFLKKCLTYGYPYCNIWVYESEVNKMSPRTGRPIVGNEPKNKRISLRATETTVRKFQECADNANLTQTELFEEMVDDYHNRIKK